MQQQQHMTIEKIIVGKYAEGNQLRWRKCYGWPWHHTFLCSIANGYYPLMVIIKHGRDRKNLTWSHTAFANQYQRCIEILGGSRWKCSVCSMHEETRHECRIVGWNQEFCILVSDIYVHWYTYIMSVIYCILIKSNVPLSQNRLVYIDNWWF